MPSWPFSLPAFPLVENYQEEAADTLVRTQMETGPAKLRQRTTAGTGKLRLSFFLSREQVEELEEFYLSELMGGALQFDFMHPRLQNTVSCRFLQPPEYIPNNGLYFRVNLALEVLP